MTKILLSLVSNKSLSAKLGFKGGTALYLFYDLDRFSTDLDFDLLGEAGDGDVAKIKKIIADNLTIVDEKSKRFTWFWKGSYEKGQDKIKVEVNTRQYPNEYERRDYRGYSMLVIKKEFMFAHKLCAVFDRKSLQNRDLYDIWWMLRHDFEVAESILQLRMGMGVDEYWKKLLILVKGLPAKYDILAGLGEVMGEPRKDWVREHLFAELELELASRAKNL